MKKILTTAAAVFALVAVSNAQLFIGGNVGFSSMNNVTNKTKDDAIKRDGSTMSINFNPKVGYQLNDKMSVGATLILGTTSVKNLDGSADNKLVSKDVENEIGIAPFFRYTFVEFGDFQLSGEARLPFTMESSKLKPEEGDDAKGPSTMNIGFDIRPVVSYSLSDRISLEADINIFGLAYNFSSYTEDQDNKDNKVTSSNFSLNIQDKVATSGAISIGMIFKF